MMWVDWDFVYSSVNREKAQLNTVLIGILWAS